MPKLRIPVARIYLCGQFAYSLCLEPQPHSPSSSVLRIESQSIPTHPSRKHRHSTASYPNSSGLRSVRFVIERPDPHAASPFPPHSQHSWSSWLRSLGSPARGSSSGRSTHHLPRLTCLCKTVAGSEYYKFAHILSCTFSLNAIKSPLSHHLKLWHHLDASKLNPTGTLSVISHELELSRLPWFWGPSRLAKASDYGPIGGNFCQTQTQNMFLIRQSILFPLLNAHFPYSSFCRCDVFFLKMWICQRRLLVRHRSFDLQLNHQYYLLYLRGGCILFRTCPCQKKSIPVHLQRASHKAKHDQMMGIFKASTSSSILFHSSALPIGKIEKIEDQEVEENLVPPFEMPDYVSDAMDLDDVDPSQFGLASSPSDWSSDMENDGGDSTDPKISRNYPVKLNSPWYTFPNKQVSHVLLCFPEIFLASLLLAHFQKITASLMYDKFCSILVLANFPLPHWTTVQSTRERIYDMLDLNMKENTWYTATKNIAHNLIMNIPAHIDFKSEDLMEVPISILNSSIQKFKCQKALVEPPKVQLTLNKFPVSSVSAYISATLNCRVPTISQPTNCIGGEYYCANQIKIRQLIYSICILIFFFVETFMQKHKMMLSWPSSMCQNTYKL
ncbi:hypothetical protein VP01_892g2 [Puccinia sorghi]|uniref:Uncharacterized protein n=1 Tax=Puccinia sorghi TaxID=27349 RepID=A0A0L6UA66_9BASI|nr:hypothetical protein VP01_892g2 [Puccinia sorghi]